jgi:hypothetical protein
MRQRSESRMSRDQVMASNHGHFVWYELLTTDMVSAEAFYRGVLEWDGRDASTPAFAYRLLSTADAPVCGLMGLPPEALASGARPRWVGYVAVDDIDATVALLRAQGGAVYVPPTDSNIGRVSIVADPQSATLALVQGLTIEPPPAGRDKVGRVGWHELLASDWRKAFAFYSALFGWQKTGDGVGSIDDYQLFAEGGHTLGGMFTKLPRAPVPFWLYYFDVADIDAAIGRVTALGGRPVQGPVELPNATWIARCIDPQGAMFALQGRRLEGRSDKAALEIGWSAEWGGFASRGRILSKPDASKATSPPSRRKPETTAKQPMPPRKPTPPKR